MKQISIERKQFRENLKRKVRGRIEVEEFRQELKRVTKDYHAVVKYLDRNFLSPKTISLRDML